MRNGVNIGTTACIECAAVMMFRTVEDSALAQTCSFDSPQAEQWHREAYENAGKEVPPLLRCFEASDVYAL